MSIPRLILLITLSALGGLVVLLMVIDCVGDITAPPPEPTSTPRPRIGDWTGVGAGEMTNYDGLQLRCFKGQPFIYAGPFQRTLYHGEAVPPPLDGGVEAKVVGADGTLVKQFYYSEHPLSPDAENMRAYISNYNNPDPTARPTPKKHSYRIGDSRDFIDALMLGARVEISFEGETGLAGLSQTWETKSDRIDGLSEAVEFLRCGI